MSNAKTFGIGPILTITDGTLMCDIGEVYDILGWLTGESLMTHQLSRASRECEGFLRERFPDLAVIEAPDWSLTPGWETLDNESKQARITEWLDDVGTRVGRTREVPRLPAEDHTRIDPLAELRMLRPDLPIIVVSPEGGAE